MSTLEARLASRASLTELKAPRFQGVNGMGAGVKTSAAAKRQQRIAEKNDQVTGLFEFKTKPSCTSASVRPTNRSFSRARSATPLLCCASKKPSTNGWMCPSDKSLLPLNNGIPSLAEDLRLVSLSPPHEELGLRNLLLLPTMDDHQSWLCRIMPHLSYTYSYLSNQHHYYQVTQEDIFSDPLVLSAFQKFGMNSGAGDFSTFPSTSDDDILRSPQGKAVSTKISSIFQGIRDRISYSVLRVVFWWVLQLWNLLLRCFVIDKSQMETLRQLGEETSPPIVYLPLHRSHLDSFVITWILMYHNIRAPLFAAGDNLKIPFFGYMLNRMGAFFIRRRFTSLPHGPGANAGGSEGATEEELIYRRVLYSYMVASLNHGHHLGMYLEGTRSRTGKPLPAKGGLLSFIVDAYLRGLLPKGVQFVPISISYERTLEGNFNKELLGQPKKPETAWATLKGIFRILRGHYGGIRVEFGQPILLPTFLRSHSELIPSQPIPSPTGFISGETVSSCSSFPSLESAAEASGRPVPSDGFVHSENPAEMCSDEEADRKRFRDLVTQLGQHAVSAAESALPLNSSHLVALTLLSFCPKRPSVSVCHLPLNEVLYRLQIFAQALQGVQRTLSVPSNPRIAVEVAVDLLSHDFPTTSSLRWLKKGEVNNNMCVAWNSTDLIPTDDCAWLEMGADVEPRLHLSYYANHCFTALLPDALIAASLSSKLEPSFWCGGHGGADTNTSPYLVDRSKVLSAAHALGMILETEGSMCSPCASREEVLEDALERLVHESVLSTYEQEGVHQMAKKKSLFLMDALGEEEQQEEARQQFQVSTSPRSMARLSLLSSVVQTEVRTYAASLQMLYELVTGDPPMDLFEEGYFLSLLTERLRRRLDVGAENRGECISRELMKNSLKGWVNQGFLETSREANVVLYWLPEVPESLDSVDKEDETFLEREKLLSEMEYVTKFLLSFVRL